MGRAAPLLTSASSMRSSIGIGQVPLQARLSLVVDRAAPAAKELQPFGIAGEGRGRRLDQPEAAVRVVQQRQRGILDLDGMVQRARSGGDTHGHAGQPDQQIDGMDRLIDQHAAAFVLPRAAPGPAPVVRIGPMPEGVGAGPQQPAQPAGVQGLFQAEGEPLVPALENHAQGHAGTVTRGDHRIALGGVAGHRFLAQHVHAGLGCGQRHRRVQVVRGADGDDIGLRLRQQLPVIGVPRAAVLGRERAAAVFLARGNRHKLGSRHATNGGGMDRRNVADPDNCETHQRTPIADRLTLILPKHGGRADARLAELYLSANAAQSTRCRRGCQRTRGCDHAPRRETPQDFGRRTPDDANPNHGTVRDRYPARCTRPRAICAA